jgi:hypothetical protein
MTSKSGQDLARFFHEVANAAMELPESTFLLDGELVIPQGKNFLRLSFAADPSGQIMPPNCPSRHRRAISSCAAISKGLGTTSLVDNWSSKKLKECNQTCRR